MAANKTPKCGTKHYKHKLEADDVLLVRQLIAERERLLREARELTNAKIGEKFEVHPNTIWKLANYASYKDCA